MDQSSGEELWAVMRPPVRLVDEWLDRNAVEVLVVVFLVRLWLAWS